MGPWFKDREHLVRLAVLLAAGLTVFLLVRPLLIPKDFGKYGHFRAGALADNAARPLSFAGRAACEECHTDVVAARAGSKHARIGCEACHGAQAAHAADPSAVKPARPDPRKLCVVCHARSVARPATFPQIDVAEHAGDSKCTECHKHHHPEVEQS